MEDRCDVEEDVGSGVVASDFGGRMPKKPG